MSLVVAVRAPGGWELRSDLGVYLGSTLYLGTPKVWAPHPGSGLGVVGSAAWCQLARDVAWPEEPTVDAWRAAQSRAVEDAGYEPVQGDVAVWVLGDRAYHVQGVESVDEVDQPFWAIGSGADYVLGLLDWWTAQGPILAAAATAVEVAARVTSEVRGVSPAVWVGP